jgi:hypothetical protein
MSVSKARRNRVKELWSGLPESWRTELMSAFHTFVPVFVGALLLSFQTTGDISWSKEAAVAVLAAALRAGFKAVSMSIFSRTLPDPKDK